MSPARVPWSAKMIDDFKRTAIFECTDQDQHYSTFAALWESMTGLDSMASDENGKACMFFALRVPVVDGRWCGWRCNPEIAKMMLVADYVGAPWGEDFDPDEDRKCMLPTAVQQ